MYKTEGLIFKFWKIDTCQMFVNIAMCTDSIGIAFWEEWNYSEVGFLNTGLMPIASNLWKQSGKFVAFPCYQLRWTHQDFIS